MTLLGPPREPPTDRSLSRLAPPFAAKVEHALAALLASGHPSKVAESFRSKERQAWLYGFGRRYDDGRGIVTYARTVQNSWHGYGLAVDIIHAHDKWAASPAYWVALRTVVEGLGLVSGSRWGGWDKPHVQWGQMPPSPTTRHQAMYKKGDLRVVWRAVGCV